MSVHTAPTLIVVYTQLRVCPNTNKLKLALIFLHSKPIHYSVLWLTEISKLRSVGLLFFIKGIKMTKQEALDLISQAIDLEQQVLMAFIDNNELSETVLVADRSLFALLDALDNYAE